ncbi:MAG: hypothetical protein WCY58_08925 [Mariniphaga sp.]|nr:hypothetical protein [Mariniphaga sp.]MDD4227332.1 hypothetical protein [Mariniphaga sp.]
MDKFKTVSNIYNKMNHNYTRRDFIRNNSLIGKEVAILVNKHQSIGKYTVQWSDANLLSGMYLAKLKILPQNKTPVIVTKKVFLKK